MLTLSTVLPNYATQTEVNTLLNTVGLTQEFEDRYCTAKTAYGYYHVRHISSFLKEKGIVHHIDTIPDGNHFAKVAVDTKRYLARPFCWNDRTDAIGNVYTPDGGVIKAKSWAEAQRFADELNTLLDRLAAVDKIASAQLAQLQKARL